MLEVFLLLGFLLVLFVSGLTLMNVKVMAALLVIELFSLPGLWLIFRRSPPFVPTPQKIMNTMMKLAKVKEGQTVYDLGCGDGRLLIEAAKKGAHAIGYEFSYPTYLLAWFRTRNMRDAVPRFGNFWKQSYDDADVIFCYLLTHTMKEFQEKIWPQLKAGTRVVSHCFKMPDIAYAEAENGVYVYVK
ncbi:MAG TPA: 50S ribosomal protein L11 methyltransferase [Candidatus Peribacteraceae bacterium]|nr:50S ribosomal protein L11 methyltransferase [Candidatus Peribacteraceae bacterium]